MCSSDLISKLSAFVHWITSKEIHVASIPWWRQEIVDIVCMFEKELSTSGHITQHCGVEVEFNQSI